MDLSPRQHKTARRLFRRKGGAVCIVVQVSDQKCLVDADDFAMIAKHNWYLRNGYACAWIDKKNVYMHKLILGSKRKEITDHINRDKLDNRKSNLRIISQGENCANRITCGVWLRKSGNWTAEIWYKKKKINLGTYSTKDWAIKAYQQAKFSLYGVE